MPAVYPGAIRSFSTHVDLTETVFALHMNDVQNEVMAIESVLGTNPQGAATGPATVGNRIGLVETGKADVAHVHDPGAPWVGLTTATHDVDTRHTFGAALGNPALPSPVIVGDTGTAGTGAHPAKEDHAHPVPSGQQLAAAVFPPGTIVAYGGTTAPTGWVLCDGTSYLRGSTSADPYFNLYSAIGTAYGNADGTHFNVPDLRNKFPMGRATPTTAVVSGGSRNAVLVTHSHTVNSHSHGGATGGQSSDHSHSGTTGFTDRAGSHNHDVFHTHYAKVADNPGSTDQQGWPANQTHGTFRTSDRPMYAGVYGLVGSDAMSSGTTDTNHLHGFSTSGSSTGHTHGVTAEAPGTNTQGVSATDANLPPYQTVNWLIKL